MHPEFAPLKSRDLVVHILKVQTNWTGTQEHHLWLLWSCFVASFAAFSIHMHLFWSEVMQSFSIFLFSLETQKGSDLNDYKSFKWWLDIAGVVLQLASF